MKKLYVMLAVSILAFSACSKDDEPKAGTGAAELYTRVIGKWTFANITLDAPPSTGRTTFSRQAPLARTTEAEVQSFIEFQSDSTYYLYDSEGKFYQGTFTVKDSVTISLGDFGTLNNITFAQGVLNFTLLYYGTKEIVITANKAPGVALTDSTKLFCRNWHLTQEDDGAMLYKAARVVFNANGEAIGSFVADSITFQMTSAGTYIVRMFKDKQLRTADVFYWKWHSSLPAYFVYWDSTNEPNEELNKAQIRELTKDVFRMSEDTDHNGDGIISANESGNWTFTPTDK